MCLCIKIWNKNGQIKDIFKNFCKPCKRDQPKAISQPYLKIRAFCQL